MALNFVKFQRGSQEAYNRLKTAHRLESDALYFIYDKDYPDEGGLLYLGEVLIGGAGTSGAKILDELIDVNMGGTALLDGMILQFNQQTSKWVPKPIKQAIENAGADLNIDLPIVETTTKSDSETVNSAINRIDSNPLEGDIVFVNGTPYIYDGSNWVILTGSDLTTRVTNLETTVNGMNNSITGLTTTVGNMQTELGSVDGRIAAAIQNANHLTYKIEDTLPTITSENANSLSKTVFLIPNGNTDGDDKYDEYMYIASNNAYEKLGSWGANLDNYVTTTTFETRVGNLEAGMANLSSTLAPYLKIVDYKSEVGDINTLRAATGNNSSTVIDEVVNLSSRLQWHELSETE